MYLVNAVVIKYLVSQVVYSLVWFWVIFLSIPVLWRKVNAMEEGEQKNTDQFYGKTTIKLLGLLLERLLQYVQPNTFAKIVHAEEVS
jgi:hypothetical protein